MFLSSLSINNNIINKYSEIYINLREYLKNSYYLHNIYVNMGIKIGITFYIQHIVQLYDIKMQ